jgi:hypothetical protein
MVAIGLSPAAAMGFSSRAANWSTRGSVVVCGIALGVPGTAIDPGTQAQLEGLWPGLQCSTPDMPRPRNGVGDPFVQLGQGRSGRARLVAISQDDLASATPYVPLRPASTWKRDGITCTVGATSVRCTNSARHGFTLSPGRLHRF